MRKQHCSLIAFISVQSYLPLPHFACLFLATASFENSLHHLAYLPPTALTLSLNSTTPVPAALALLWADAGTNSLIFQNVKNSVQGNNITRRHPRTLCWQTCWTLTVRSSAKLGDMDSLGLEPSSSHMQRGRDTTTLRAKLVIVFTSLRSKQHVKRNAKSIGEPTLTNVA